MIRKIGILGALITDVRFFLQAMENYVIEKHLDTEFYVGMLNNYKIILTYSGIGKVNAAITSQFLIDNYNVEVILNIGIAGSISPNVKVGDIVIARDIIQHDVDLRSVGCPIGVIPQMQLSNFYANEDLIEIALRCSNFVNKHCHTYIGRVASGDQFVSDAIKREEIRRTFSALCVDMESGAIAQAAALNAISFLVIKFISDNADGNASIEYRREINISYAFFYKLILELLKQLNKL